MSKIKNAKICLLSTAAFSLAANAFAYFNLIPHHDALNHALYFANNWEVSLGRFLHPFWEALFGNITAPWFTGLLSILFLAATAWFCIEILNIRSKVGIVLTAGFLSINFSITELCGTFGFVLGSYTCALMLVCAGVWMVVARQGKRAIFAAAVLCALSMGLYQAYITVALALFLILGMQQAILWKGPRHHLREWLRFAASLAIGGALYFATYKLVLLVTGIAEPNSYNSLAQLAQMNIGYVANGIAITYRCFLKFLFWDPAPATRIFAIFNALLVVATIGAAVIRIIQQGNAKARRLILLFACLALFPVASLLMQVLMHDKSMNFLVSYAVFLLYPGCIALIEASGHPLNLTPPSKTDITRNAIPAFCLICGLILFSFVHVSNEAYSISKLAYDRAVSATTIIAADMRQIEDYVPGETEVVVVGKLSTKNAYVTPFGNADRFNALRGYENIAITYPLTFGSFMNLMGHPTKVNRKESDKRSYAKKPEVKSMPSYPTEGYCRMVDGTMVVKLS